MTQGALPWRVQCHETLDSTQTAAIDAAQRGEAGRLAILAHRQTAGRGRDGRSWTAPSGNLNLSILLRPSGRPDPGQWALHAGVALHDTLSDYAAGLMLKWPNDVLLDGCKIGGVLIDSGLDVKGELDWVVVGVGANLRAAPSVEGRVTACLPPPGADAARVAHSFLRRWDHWAQADIRAAWLDRAHAIGTMIDMVTPDRRVRGRFAGLSPRGELLLQGEAPVSSAEVFLATPHVPQAAPCCSS